MEWLLAAQQENITNDFGISKLCPFNFSITVQACDYSAS